MPSSILVIEDEPAISELISVNLQHAGHCPIRAYNAEQAQNLISDVLPDLVLLDWMLPGKSGIAFARDGLALAAPLHRIGMQEMRNRRMQALAFQHCIIEVLILCIEVRPRDCQRRRRTWVGRGS